MFKEFTVAANNEKSLQSVKLTWSYAKAENVGKDAHHAQVRHPGYIVLFACGQESKTATMNNFQVRRR